MKLRNLVKFVALAMGATMAGSAWATNGNVLTLGVTANVVQVCYVSDSTGDPGGNVGPVVITPFDITPGTAVDEVLSDVYYLCNDPGGWKITLDSPDNTFNLTDGTNDIPYTLTFIAPGLDAMDSISGAPQATETMVGLSLQVEATATQVPAGEYTDTITLEIQSIL